VSTADGSIIQALCSRHSQIHPKTTFKNGKFHSEKCFDSSKCYVLKSNHSLFLQKLHFCLESQAVSLTLCFTPQH